MTTLVSTVIHLHGVEIDVMGECVRAAGVEHRLRHKTFEVLLYLIENRNRDVSKAEIFENVWAGMAVTEDTLVQSIVEIRRALGDDPRSPRFVRTVPRVGYQLIAPVETFDHPTGGELQPSTALMTSGPAALRSFELEERQSLEVAVEEVEEDWRHFIPHVTIAAVAIALAALAAFWMQQTRLAAPVPSAPASRPSIPAPDSHLSDRMTDSLDAYEEYRQGVAAADGLENTQALAHFERAIALDPSFAMAHARIGYTYAVTWMLPEKARPHFELALASGARITDRERLYVLGWQAIGNRDFSRAIDHFRLIISRYPTDVEAYGRLGKLLIGEERLDEAIDVLRRGLVVEPDAAQLHNALGSAYSYRGQHEEAITHHRRYVGFAPSQPNAHDSLGLSYQAAGEYEKALAAYAEALRLNPRFEVAVVHRANTYWQSGRVLDAIREMKRFIAMAPSPEDRARGYSELAAIYRGLGTTDQQAAAVREAVREGADRAPYEILLTIDRGDISTASARVESMPSSIPGRGVRVPVRLYSFVRAEVARAAGAESQALDYARETLRHDPPVYLLDDMEDVLGDTLSAFGRHEEAVVEYRRILKGNSRRGRTRFKLARALDALGRTDEARLEYQRFLAVWSRADADAPEMVAARKRLS